MEDFEQMNASPKSESYIEGFLGVCYAQGISKQAATVMLANLLESEPVTAEAKELLKMASLLQQARERRLKGKTPGDIRRMHTQSKETAVQPPPAAQATTPPPAQPTTQV